MPVLIHVLAHLLTAILTICICIYLGLTAPSGGIVAVDSDVLLQRFTQSNAELPEGPFKTQVQTYLTTMEIVLRDLAREREVTIIRSDLAIAGARDLTDEAYDRALARMAQGQGAS